MANDSRLSDPLAVAKDVTQSVGVSAVDFRYDLGGLSQPYEGATYGFSAGVLPGSSPGAAIVDLAVNANSPVSLTTVVNPGNYVITRIGNGMYTGAVTGSVTCTHTSPNPANPRIDYVIIRLREPGIDPPTVSATASIVVLAGTAAVSPAPPTAQLTDGDMVLAAVTVRAATTSILGSDIADLRVHVTARGGIYPKSAVDSRSGAYRGQYRDNAASTGLERWDGTRWRQVANPSPWTQYTPTLYYAGGSTPPGVAGTAGLGTGATEIGRFVAMGSCLYLNIVWTWGAAPFNGGYGPLFTYLPGGFYNEATCDTHLPVRLTVMPSGDWWQGHCYIPANSNLMMFVMPKQVTDCRVGFYQVASSPGAPGTGIPLVPGNYPEGGQLVVNGSLEIA